MTIGIIKDASLTCITLVTNHKWFTFITFYSSKSFFAWAITIDFSTFQSCRTIRITFAVWNGRIQLMLQNTRLINLGNLLDKMDNHRSLVGMHHTCHQLHLVNIHHTLFLCIPLCKSKHLCYHILKQLNPQDYICSLKRKNMMDISKTTMYCTNLDMTDN